MPLLDRLKATNDQANPQQPGMSQAEEWVSLSAAIGVDVERQPLPGPSRMSSPRAGPNGLGAENDGPWLALLALVPQDLVDQYVGATAGTTSPLTCSQPGQGILHYQSSACVSLKALPSDRSLLYQYGLSCTRRRSWSNTPTRLGGNSRRSSPSSCQYAACRHDTCRIPGCLNRTHRATRSPPAF